MVEIQDSLGSRGTIYSGWRDGPCPGVLQLVSGGARMRAELRRCVRLHGRPSPNSAPGTAGEPSARGNPDLGPGDRTLAHRPARSFPSAPCLGGSSCSNGSRSPGRPGGRIPEAGSPRSGRRCGRLPGHVLFLAVPSFALTLCRETERASCLGSLIGARISS